MRELWVHYDEDAPTRCRLSGRVEIEAYPPNAAGFDAVRMIVLRSGERTVVLPPHTRLEFAGGR